MGLEQLFVGGVAMVLGALGIAAAIANRDAHFEFHKIRRIEDWGGRGAARAVYLIVGIVLVVLGLAIALGLTRRSERPAARPSSAAQAARETAHPCSMLS